MWYYEFATDAIERNPGSTSCFRTATTPADAPIPSSTCSTAAPTDFRQFDFLGIRDLTAGKPIIVVMPDGGHAGWYSQPGQLVRRPAELGDIPHRPAAPLDRGELPNVRRVRRPCGRRVLDGRLRRAEVRSQVLRPLRLGERPLRPGEPAPRLRPGRALGKHHLGRRGTGRRHGLRRAAGTRPGSAPTTRSSESRATGTSGSSWSPAPVRTRSTGSTACNETQVLAGQREFREALSAAGIPHESHEVPGGHVLRRSHFIDDLNGILGRLRPAG